MSENTPIASAGTGGQAPTMQMYKEEQQKLKTMLERRNQLARKLAALENEIEQKETAYLEETPHGNIVAGFDNYIKGSSGGGANRRKQGPSEQNRVFSRSSISYRPGSEATTPGSTPASHAPTPQSTSFKDNNGATPTSATTNKGNKKGKKQNDEESEAESQQGTNKKRINFGTSRK